jgi:hypothetical protein
VASVLGNNFQHQFMWLQTMSFSGSSWQMSIFVMTLYVAIPQLVSSSAGFGASLAIAQIVCDNRLSLLSFLDH